MKCKMKSSLNSDWRLKIIQTPKRRLQVAVVALRLQNEIHLCHNFKKATCTYLERYHQESSTFPSAQISILNMEWAGRDVTELLAVTKVEYIFPKFWIPEIGQNRISDIFISWLQNSLSVQFFIITHTHTYCICLHSTLLSTIFYTPGLKTIFHSCPWLGNIYIYNVHCFQLCRVRC